MRSGVRIACDVGTVRIGIARSDATGMLAVPLDAVRAGEHAVAEVAGIAGEWDALEVLVGLPLSMDGTERSSAALARAWAAGLAAAVPMPVRLVDERLSTVQAQRGLHEAGKSTRQSRARIDSASAVVFLQAALDTEARTGLPAGVDVRRAGDTSERGKGQ